MNKVDNLLKTKFSMLKQEEKLEVKRLGPHQPKNFQLVQAGNGKQNRLFSCNWFNKTPWLTASQEKNALFCFYCLLFGGETTWSEKGFQDLKHLSERIKKHESSAGHISNAVKFKIFGTVNISSQLDSGHKVSVHRHNELVKKNRHVLNRIIDCIKFCGIHELALRGHNEKETSFNRGVFLDLLTHVAGMDSAVEDHLNNATVAKYTSNIIQNELLDCMYNVYEEELKKDIEAANFVSVQADETTDISCMSQFVIILRFVKGGMPVERFLSFIELHDRTAEGLTSVLKCELEKFGLKSKLIGQTYDGAAVMSGSKSGVQIRMKEFFPYAHYIHCYAHQLNLVLKQVCTSIKDIRVFFANLSGFSSFFSMSSKRTDVLISVCNRKIPKPAETRWNFQSRVINSVYENKEELLECFDTIQNGCNWDDISVRESIALANFLQDNKFKFFLAFLYKILYHVDILYNILQAQKTTAVTVQQALQNFKLAVTDIRENISFADENDISKPKRIRLDATQLIANAKEACDIVICQMTQRFQSAEFLVSFAMIDPKKFNIYQKHFPTHHFETFTHNYPMLVKDKLKSELEVLYSNETFNVSAAKSITGLSKIIVDSDLTSTLSEVSKVLEIVLATPVSSAESERCFSTLKRIKSFLRNSMLQDRLNALAVLSIHKDLVDGISNFNNRVIESFASLKNRRAEFLFK